jgi:hypothetical protein
LLVESSSMGAGVLNGQAENQFKSSAYCHPISTLKLAGGRDELNPTGLIRI